MILTCSTNGLLISIPGTGMESSKAITKRETTRDLEWKCERNKAFTSM
jgi:hypothetical protein